jgi:hypothetical protein
VNEWTEASHLFGAFKWHEISVRWSTGLWKMKRNSQRYQVSTLFKFSLWNKMLVLWKNGWIKTSHLFRSFKLQETLLDWAYNHMEQGAKNSHMDYKWSWVTAAIITYKSVEPVSLPSSSCCHCQYQIDKTSFSNSENSEHVTRSWNGGLGSPSTDSFWNMCV